MTNEIKVRKGRLKGELLLLHVNITADSISIQLKCELVNILPSLKTHLQKGSTRYIYVRSAQCLFELCCKIRLSPGQ